MPKQDSLHQFVALRSALERERESLQKRLREIDQALGSRTASPSPAPAAARATAPAKRGRRGGRRGGGRRGGNAMNLREAIARATARTPLSVRDIVNSVKGSGYKFKSKNPVNSVGAYLYGPEGKKHFKRADGKFAPK